MFHLGVRLYWNDAWNALAVTTSLGTCGASVVSGKMLPFGSNLAVQSETIRSFAALLVWFQMLSYPKMRSNSSSSAEMTH